MVDGFVVGEVLGSSGFTRTVPRRWTVSEVEWCLARRAEGWSVERIAGEVGRSVVSVQVKLKRVSKVDGSYNARFRGLKYAANERFLGAVEPGSVLDVFAGVSWWRNAGVECVTNDVDESFGADFCLDAFDFLCDVWRGGERFDVVDLDPFGSAYECFDFAVRVARKGVVVSFGEWGHRRWKRFDFVGPRYGVECVEDFVVERFVGEFQRVARLHKKRAEVFEVLQYGHFLRVYFVLEGFKELSQWGV